MKIGNSSVEIVREPNILKRIELAGRTCYNSQHLITDTSYEKFITNIIARGHGSVLEHSNIAYKYYTTVDELDIEYVYEWMLARKAVTGSHVLITLEHKDNEYFILISGNVRAWFDFIDEDVNDEHLIDSEDSIANFKLQLHEDYPLLFAESAMVPWKIEKPVLLTEEELLKINPIHTYYTFKIVTTRDISHQLVRHRTLSFSQQSQRWVNYTLDKNDGEITFIMPRIDENMLDDFEAECENIQSLYFKMIESGLKPEVARSILPNCTKTIIYITGKYLDWENFVNLRTEPGAQKEIQDIALQIDKEIKKYYIDLY